MAMNQPAPRHLDLLQFIRAELETKGVPPTFAEMQWFMGISSKSMVHQLLGELERLRLIRRTPHRRQAIELLPAKDYHRPDCPCEGCAETRYFEQLKLVHALQFSPPPALVPKLKGLRPVSELTKLYWLRGFPRSLRPRSAA
jgi:SOS-response transcriptional repressor LexA